MRRRKMEWLGAAAVLASAFSLAEGASAQTVKVGVILTLSGPEAEAGDEMQKGMQLYVKQHQKELPPGVKVELVTRDDTGPNPGVAKRLAQELITREHVQLLAGEGFSPNAAAIAPLTKEAKVLFVITNAAGVAIPRLSRYVVRTSFTLWQIALPMGQWAAKNGCKTAYVAISDFIPGHDAEGAFTKGFTDDGGKIVGNLRFPLVSPDYVPVVERIKNAKPDCAFVFVPGGKQSTAFVKAWSDAGLKQTGIRLVTTQDVMLDDEFPNMGDTPLGVVSSGNYSPAATRPQNRAFIAAWNAAYGAQSIPDFFAVDSYDGMAAIFDLVKATKGKFTADEAMAFLSHWKNPDSPRGPISIDPQTRDIVQNIYIRRVEKVNGKLANIEFATIPNQKDPWKDLHPAK
jgi:branched-chain amino acid transport system substrate-binding protein